MENTAKSTNLAVLQLHQLLGKQPLPVPSTTLNEKFDVSSSEELATGEIPFLNGLVIGNGGHFTSPGVNDVTRILGVRRKPRAGALYGHLPFVLREIDDDLSTADIAKYRMRKVIDIDGNLHVAYYMKRIDTDAIDILSEYKNIENGVVTTTDFVPDSQDLNPVPPNISDINVPQNDYISVTAKVPFILDEDEVNEILNAANIIYGEDGYGYISEVGIVTGVDRSVTQTINAVEQTYLETVYAQLASSLNTGIALEFGKPIQSTHLSLGSTDPLYLGNDN